MWEAHLAIEDLAPLPRGGWRGVRPAFDCLARQARLITLATREVHKRSGNCRCPGYPDHDDLQQETLAALMERAARHAGLELPKDWTPEQDLAPWLFRVLEHQATDLVRRALAGKRAGTAVHVSIDDVHCGDTERDQDGVAARMDGERIEALMGRLIESSSTPTHALAWVLLRHPSRLSRSLVERASVRDPRGHLDTVHGLAREPAQTWDLLMDWVPRHAADPGSDASRRELAWILRSADQQGSGVWRAAEPRAAGQARDTLRKWENRFHPCIQALLDKEEP